MATVSPRLGGLIGEAVGLYLALSEFPTEKVVVLR